MSPIPTSDELDQLATQAGDRAALEALARSVWRLAYRHAHRLARKFHPVEAEDLHARGMTAIVGAVRHWRAARGGFLTYFATACCRAMTRHGRGEARRREVSGTAVPDVPAPPGEDGFDLTDLRQAMASLPRPTWAVVERYYGIAGRSARLQDVAKELRLPRLTAKQLLADGLDELRRQFGTDGQVA